MTLIRVTAPAWFRGVCVCGAGGWLARNKTPHLRGRTGLQVVGLDLACLWAVVFIVHDIEHASAAVSGQVSSIESPRHMLFARMIRFASEVAKRPQSYGRVVPWCFREGNRAVVCPPPPGIARVRCVAAPAVLVNGRFSS